VDLFEDNRQRLIAAESPLADRMRPRSLEEFIGQDHILEPGRLLRRAIQADQLSSLIFYERLRDAEEAIYADPQDILVNWDVEDLQQAFTEAGLRIMMEMENQQKTDTRITAAMIDRWFTASNPTYASRLRPALLDSEIALVGKIFSQRLQSQIIPWKSQTVFLLCRF
jgi:hypothetical protein